LNSLSFVKPLKFYKRDKILRIRKFIHFHSKKTEFLSRIWDPTKEKSKLQLNNLYTLNKKKAFFYSKDKEYNKLKKNQIVNFNIYEKYKLIFFMCFLKNFHFLKFLANNNNDFLFKIIQFIPIFKYYLMNNFKVYLKYEIFFFSIKSHFNINPIYFKPSFVLNQKNSNFSLNKNRAFESALLQIFLHAKQSITLNSRLSN
jgi:hypothetical protein